MAVRAVRGAIQIENNNKEDIERGVVRLINKIIFDNEIFIENIISIIFSQTNDLDTMNPAAALRTIGFEQTALFCTQEPYVLGSMAKVIRVLITVESEKKLSPIYLDGAKNLRLDINT